jgi:hypothetical protein
MIEAGMIALVFAKRSLVKILLSKYPIGKCAMSIARRFAPTDTTSAPLL